MTYMIRPHSRTRALGRRIALREILAVWRQRRALAHLDDSRLDDIGISRDEARQEARRPVWDVPRNWIA
ncbi:DUF1127 domain-containing protein [Roseovarius amoyensis]|uniref:DUF1127 domain-containing protein n=1 Tax=Roseovarius amoyensis TaxID=2211448 RepID=UPI000DBE9631